MEGWEGGIQIGMWVCLVYTYSRACVCQITCAPFSTNHSSSSSAPPPRLLLLLLPVTAAAWSTAQHKKAGSITVSCHKDWQPLTGINTGNHWQGFPLLLAFVVGGLGFEFCVFVAGWRHALRSEWPFINIIITGKVPSQLQRPSLQI